MTIGWVVGTDLSTATTYASPIFLFGTTGSVPTGSEQVVVDSSILFLWVYFFGLIKVQVDVIYHYN